MIFELSKRLFSLPVPDPVAGKDEIHSLQCPLVRIWIQCPHNDDAQEVHRPEDVRGLFIETVEYRLKKRHLRRVLRKCKW